MNFIDDIENNSILLIPNNIKNKVLDYINDTNTLKSIKIISFNDLKTGLYYTYNNETIKSIMTKYNINYTIAKTFIENTYYVEKRSNNKIDNIIEIKEYLNQNNLLIKDDLFIQLLKSRTNLYVYGYTNINKFNNNLLDIASKYINIKKIATTNNDYKHDVYEFNTINEEVLYVADSILALIENGVDINKIYISNYSDEYYFTLKRIFKSMNIPIYLKNKTTLYETAIGLYFINNLKDDIEALLKEIKEKFNVDHNKNNTNVYNTLFSLLNTYYWTNSYVAIKDIIEYEMHHTTINTPHYDNEIKVIDLIDNVIEEDEYIFLLNFNLGQIPKFIKDEDYIDDKIKTNLQESTNEYNKNIKESYLKALKNIKNITITYKLSTYFETYTGSFLIDNDYLKVTHREYPISIYNDEINILELTKKIDNLIKFNTTDETLSILNNTYEIPYKEYDNSYKQIDTSALINFINNKINFSYSSITKYYQCPFSYYLGNILKIGTYEQTIDAFIGSLFHDTLSKCLDNPDSIDSVYEEYIKNSTIELTNKDMFFINMLKKEAHFIVDTINEQYTHSHHKKAEYEKNIEIEVTRKIKTKLKGFVDKILYYDNKAIIIDYKTGNETIDESLFQYGLKIQLPIYLYLLKLYDENIEVIGLYIQKLMDLNIAYDPNKDYLEEKTKKLKLIGITFDDINSLKEFDDTYENSSVIHALGLKQDGTFKSASKVLDLNKRESLIKTMEELINNSIDKVTEGNFEIHPLKIAEKYIDACKYCEFKDVCYRKFKDFNTIILGGEEDE